MSRFNENFKAAFEAAKGGDGHLSFDESPPDKKWMGEFTFIVASSTAVAIQGRKDSRVIIGNISREQLRQLRDELTELLGERN